MMTSESEPAVLDRSAVERTLSAAKRALLAERVPAGHWEGELSSSALSTATAACALEVVRRNGVDEARLGSLARGGIAWIAGHQNPDGGFGDTTDSPSNISTTALCWAALDMFRDNAGDAFSRAEQWLKSQAGDLAAPSLSEAIGKRYGKDRTFAVPILTMCAIAGRFGGGREAWRSIPRLPFELAVLPHAWFRWLNLRVVSYALPALIAIGQALHRHHPTRNPFAFLARTMTRRKTLRILESIQPESGGFLEAAPLTSFVTMSLAASGEAGHPVTRKAVSFLADTVREDGSWPIDTNLATWVTTLSVRALSAGAKLGESLSNDDQRPIRAWLLGQQLKDVHPYTRAAPGGWAWTDRSGGVPDADDTPGALLALSHLRPATDDDELRRAAAAGVRWLLDLQNRDGGIPTFCRGWGKLPFDQSCPDLTAHVLRAWDAWKAELPGDLARETDAASHRAVRYLIAAQRNEGSWIPLWFGNQHAGDLSNPVYGTARVLLGAPPADREEWGRARERAIVWLASAQNADGGFGGGPGIPSTIEETALSVEALAAAGGHPQAVARGCRWLAERTAEGTRFDPSPIGLYFGKLWYREKLYPIIFSIAALERVLQNLRSA